MRLATRPGSLICNLLLGKTDFGVILGAWGLVVAYYLTGLAVAAGDGK